MGVERSLAIPFTNFLGDRVQPPCVSRAFPIEVPPLRARSTDVPLRSEAFFAPFVHRLGRKRRKLTCARVQRLPDYPSRGNERELEHVIGRDMLTSGSISLDVELPGSELTSTARSLAAARSRDRAQ